MTIRSRRLDPLGAALLVMVLVACQLPDPYYEPTLANPVYDPPTVAVDTAHSNFHQVEGSYSAFAALLRADGYRVRNFDVPYVSGCLADLEACAYWNALQDIDLLVIANASDALSQEEADTITYWIFQGGALLLVTDHSPYDASSETLAQNLGLAVAGPLFNETYLRSDGSLVGTHAIANGRDASEVLNEVYTAAGTSYAEVSPPPFFATIQPLLTASSGVYQGIAVRYGLGRAYVSGEASVFTNQALLTDLDFFALYPDEIALASLCLPLPRSSRDCAKRILEEYCDFTLGVSAEQCGDQLLTQGIRTGLTTVDNQQLLLNVVHWLDGLL